VRRLLEKIAVSVPCAAPRASRIFFWPGGKSMNYGDLTNRRGTYSVAIQCILDAHFCAAQELGNKAIDEIFYPKPVEDFKPPFLSY
jgi:hypothetical protein